MLYLELIVPEGGGLLQGAIVPRDAPPNPPSLGLVIKEIIRVQTDKKRWHRTANITSSLKVMEEN